MGQEPDQIRERIEQTRSEMGETIDAIGYKADVPARAKDKVTDSVERARDSVAGTVDTIKDAVSGGASSVKDATPDRGKVSEGTRAAVGVAQQNPLGLAFGAVAAGFLVGMLLPSSRVEDERMGAAADDLKEHAAEAGQEALEHGNRSPRTSRKRPRARPRKVPLSMPTNSGRRQSSTHRQSRATARRLPSSRHAGRHMLSRMNRLKGTWRAIAGGEDPVGAGRSRVEPRRPAENQDVAANQDGQDPRRRPNADVDDQAGARRASTM